jgi:hypothetical protein
MYQIVFSHSVIAEAEHNVDGIFQAYARICLNIINFIEEEK